MIERRPLRQQVQKEILARIADHRLPPGTRINESHLSLALGISRTPLREAMLGLEALGFLASDVGRGFLVPQISADEFLEFQEMLARLAPHALGLACPLPPGQIMELNNLLGRARIRVGQVGQDQGGALGDLIYRWTALVTSGCPNRMLVEDIIRLEALSRRCWAAAVTAGFDPAAMLGGFGELYELLRTNRPDDAVAHWRDHIARFSTEAARHLAEVPRGS